MSDNTKQHLEKQVENAINQMLSKATAQFLSEHRSEIHRKKEKSNE